MIVTRARCSPPVITQNNPPIGDGPEGPGSTSLILDPETGPVYTANRETDSRTAVMRGMAEYLETMSYSQEGVPYSFQKVFQNWAEPEDISIFPSAAVYALEEGKYDSSKFSPVVDPSMQLPEPDGRYVTMPTELMQEFIVEIWANPPNARGVLVQMLEDASNPVDWMYGFRLALPHYYGAIATYELLGVSYEDNELAAQQRFRKAALRYSAVMPVIQLLDRPKLRDLDLRQTVTEGTGC